MISVTCHRCGRPQFVKGDEGWCLNCGKHLKPKPKPKEK